MYEPVLTHPSPPGSDRILRKQLERIPSPTVSYPALLPPPSIFMTNTNSSTAYEALATQRDDRALLWGIRTRTSGREG